LVVIGIIAILIGVLLPALNRARMSASNVACQANLRDIGTAIQIYAVQSKGILPPGYYDIVPPIPPGNITVVRWVDMIQGIMSARYGSNSTDAFNTNSSAARIRKVFVCPDAPNEDMLSGKTFACTYFSHPRLMPQLASPNQPSSLPWINYDPYGLARGRNDPKHPYNLGRIKRASEIALIWDASISFDAAAGGWSLPQGLPVANQIDKGRYYSSSTTDATQLTDDYSRITTQINGNSPIDFKVAFNLNDNNRDNAFNYQTARFRHMKDTSLNALMVDGHVESFKYNPRDPQKSSFLRKNINVNVQ